MTDRITGGCLCGKVRFETDAVPFHQLLCHCTDCQHVSGSAFYTAYIVPLASMTLLQGEPGSFAVKSDQGRDNTRKFCRDWGSRLWAEVGLGEGMASVNGMALDDRSHFNPISNHRLETAPGWCQVDQSLTVLPVS
ncbi:MAG: GFA family protein [Pseudomonadota bacterium]